MFIKGFKVLEFVILANVFLHFMLPPQTCADDLRCVEIKCPLEAVDSTTAVVLHARLWNNTFLEVQLLHFSLR